MMPPYRIEIPATVILWLYGVGIVLMVAAGTWIVVDSMRRMP